MACSCLTVNGGRCIREVSRRPGQNSLFCWQHQHCVTHLTESERLARMACEKASKQSFEKTGKVIVQKSESLTRQQIKQKTEKQKQDELVEFFKNFDLSTEFEMKLRVKVTGKGGLSKIVYRTYHGLDALRMAEIDLPTLLNMHEDQYMDIFEQYLSNKELLDLWGALEVERENRGLLSPDEQPMVEGAKMLTIQQFFEKYLPHNVEFADLLSGSSIDMSMLLNTTPEAIRKLLYDLSLGDQIRLWSGLTSERNRLGLLDIDEKEVDEGGSMLTLQEFIDKYSPEEQKLVEKLEKSGMTMPKLLDSTIEDLQKKPYYLTTAQLMRIWSGVQSERNRLGLKKTKKND